MTRYTRHEQEEIAVRAIALKEFRELRRDRRTLAMLFLLPFLFLVVFGYAASFDIQDVPTVVVGSGAQTVRGVLPATFDVVSTDGGGDEATAPAVAVRAERWDEAFAALSTAGLPAAVVGRDLRVPGGDEAAVRAALDAGGVSASLSVVPATFEETFVRLALARQDVTPTAPERTSQ